MSLVLEVNTIIFPEYRPVGEKDEDKLEWTAELKRKYYHQEAEVHMIKLGPVNQDILDSKLMHMDFKGVEFIWDEKSEEYRWNSAIGKEKEGAAKGMKPLPHNYMMHFFSELKKVGFQKPEYGSEDTEFMGNGEKKIYRLERKF